MSYNKYLIGALTLGLVSSAALASGEMLNPVAESQYNPGMYIGVQAGLARADEGNGFKDFTNAAYDSFVKDGYSVSKKITQGGFGGRAYLGYNFNPYFSLEAGYTYLPNNKYNLQFSTKPIDAMNIKVKTYAFDLMAKGILPIDQNWNLFAKAGAAYEHSDWDISISTAEGSTSLASNSKGAIRPAYGLGIGYNFNENLAMDLSYTGIYGQHRVSLNDLNKSKDAADIKPIPTSHLIALGITYKFKM